MTPLGPIAADSHEIELCYWDRQGRLESPDGKGWKLWSVTGAYDEPGVWLVWYRPKRKGHAGD